MAKKNVFEDVIGELIVDLTPDAMVVKTGKGKKQVVDEDATATNVKANIAYYYGMLSGLEAIAGDVAGLSDALDEHKEAYDVLFAYAMENVDGFEEFAETYGFESFNEQDGDSPFDYIADLDRSDLVAIANQLEIKVVKKDNEQAIIDKISEEVDEDGLTEVLVELGYYEDEEDDSDDEDDAESGYEDMSLGELRNECKERGIKYTPKEKAEDLIAKLEEDDEQADDDADEDEEVDYSSMSLSELRAECKERGIKYTPKQKADELIELLMSVDAESDEEDDSDDEDDAESGYEDMSLGELRNECKERGIKYTPKEKAEDLIAKLEEDDEQADDDADEDEEVDESELDKILDEEFEDEVLKEEEKANPADSKKNKKLPNKKNKK